MCRKITEDRSKRCLLDGFCRIPHHALANAFLDVAPKLGRKRLYSNNVIRKVESAHHRLELLLRCASYCQSMVVGAQSNRGGFFTLYECFKIVFTLSLSGATPGGAGEGGRSMSGDDTSGSRRSGMQHQQPDGSNRILYPSPRDMTSSTVPPISPNMTWFRVWSKGCRD